MSFICDIEGAIVYTISNPGPVGTLGPTIEAKLPLGRYQVFTDGIVFYNVGEAEVNPATAGVWIPEREFVYGADIPTTFRFGLASIGTARVIFYPEHTGKRNVEQIRAGRPPC
ncbi:MAG: hypothetical protein GY915_00920 [bacterium]|jgi:hypothetical protein|nr:hypothetical protein [bacterium]